MIFFKYKWPHLNLDLNLTTTENITICYPSNNYKEHVFLWENVEQNRHFASHVYQFIFQNVHICIYEKENIFPVSKRNWKVTKALICGWCGLKPFSLPCKCLILCSIQRICFLRFFEYIKMFSLDKKNIFSFFSLHMTETTDTKSFQFIFKAFYQEYGKQKWDFRLSL